MMNDMRKAAALMILTALLSGCAKPAQPHPSAGAQQQENTPLPAEETVREAAPGYAWFEADGCEFELPAGWFGQNAGSSVYFMNETDPFLIAFSGSEQNFETASYDEEKVTALLEEQNMLEKGAIEISHGEPYSYTSYTFRDYESQIRVYHFRAGKMIKVITVWNETGSLDEYASVISHMLETLRIR